MIFIVDTPGAFIFDKHENGNFYDFISKVLQL